MPVPAPLTSGHLCSDCKGTGADIARTLEKDRKERRVPKEYRGGYIRCWTCNGNGLDPAEYFRWGPHKPL